MNSYAGQILAIHNTETVGQKNFKKRAIILDPDPNSNYPKEVKFQLLGQNVGMPEQLGLKVGDWIDIDFEIDGRKWHSKKTDTDMWFVELNIKEIRTGRAADPATVEAEPAGNPTVVAGETDDDIPF